MPQPQKEPDHKESRRRGHPFSRFLPEPFFACPGKPLKSPGTHQGIHDEILKPCAQRHMPPAPELRNAPGSKGLPEIFLQAHPEHAGSPQSDVHCPSKIRIQLEGKTHSGQHQKASCVSLIIPVNGVHHHSQPLRDHQLLKQPPENSPQAEKHIRCCGSARLLFRSGLQDFPRLPGLPVKQCGGQTPPPHHRPCGHLREEASEKRHFPKALLGPLHTPVYLNQIPQKGQGIKRNRCRRRNRNRRPGNHFLPTRKPGQFPQRISRKIHILKSRQKRQIAEEHCQKNPLFSGGRLRGIPFLLPSPLDPPRPGPDRERGTSINRQAQNSSGQPQEHGAGRKEYGRPPALFVSRDSIHRQEAEQTDCHKHQKAI